MLIQDEGGSSGTSSELGTAKGVEVGGVKAAGFGQVKDEWKVRDGKGGSARLEDRECCLTYRVLLHLKLSLTAVDIIFFAPSAVVGVFELTKFARGGLQLLTTTLRHKLDAITLLFST